jgi:hypothetical protein
MKCAVKLPLAKVIVAVVLAIGVLAAFVARYSVAPSLAWPSLALARAGFSHTWLVTVVLLVGGLCFLAFWSRRQSWVRVIVASLLIPAIYCQVAFWFTFRAAVPLPATTTYDSEPQQRVLYLQAYEEGYRDGAIGRLRTYCFRGKVETRGNYDGSYQGILMCYRALGRPMPERVKNLYGVSAAIDGVQFDVK